MTLDGNTLWDYDQVARRLGLFKDAEKTMADVEQVKRLVREGRIKSLAMSDRRIMFAPQDIEYYIKGLRGEPVSQPVNSDNGAKPTDDTPEGKQRQIELVEKNKQLYIKNLEFETYKAGFPTLVEYKKSVDAFMKDKTDYELKAAEIEKDLTEREHAVDAVETDLFAREQALQKRLDGIEAERTEILARAKVIVKKQENSEFDNMEWAVHEFEKVILTMREWQFYDYAQHIDGRLEMIIENLNNNFTLQDLWGNFKYCATITNNLIEYTQTLKRNAQQFVGLRNELGGMLNSIQLKLHLDDERRGNNQHPALPPD